MNWTPTGPRIKALRKRLGLTQEALARRIGTTVTSVSRWENGGSTPKLYDHVAALERLAKENPPRATRKA